MRRVWTRLVERWLALLPHERRTATALTVLVVGYLAHYLIFTIVQPFYIEDCAISFAFSRHLVEGHGLVAYPGGERVEGYSNPLWTFLVSFFLLFKVSVWTSSKILGAVLGALTLPLAWAITRQARNGRNDLVNLIPPFFLAASSQFVIWNASGLENSLFCFLLAASIYRTVHEGTHGGRPLSGFLFFLLAITRPDGIAYALVGFVARLAMEVTGRRSALSILGWLGAFIVPFAIYQLWRYTYFAWPHPSTYYAKLGSGNRFRPFSWTARGWSYFREYSGAYWIGWAAPLFVVAMAGLRRWRGALGILVLILATFAVLWDGQQGLLARVEGFGDLRRQWSAIRISILLGGAILLGLLALGRPGWRALTILWASFCTGVFFNIYAGGDWMDGFRWANLWSVPQFILLGVGIGALVDILPGRDRRPVRWLPSLRAPMVVLPAVILALPNTWGSNDFAMRPVTGVRDVKRRVDYMSDVQRRLDIDHVTLLDVDMGAHVWFSGWAIADVAGLVDIRMGHHNYERAFIKEYVFDELKPDFIHSHGGWARRTRINNFKEFKERYFEIPGYPAGRRSFHLGNHVAKRHFVTHTYDGPPGREVDLQGDLFLRGWDIPAPLVAEGSSFQLDTWVQTTGRDHAFRLLVFLVDDGGSKAVMEAAPGQDLYPPDQWLPEEIASDHHLVSLPPDLPMGMYAVGLVFLDSASGDVIPAVDAEPDAPFRFMRGEILLDQPLIIATEEEAMEAGENHLREALDLAAAGSCDSAWHLWKDATRHLLHRQDWQDRNRPAMDSAMAACHTDVASAIEDPYLRAEVLILAARYRYDEPTLLAAARPLARSLMDEGYGAREARDWEHAYRAFDTAARLDTRLSWARRWAEEARDWRLNLDGVDREKPPRQRPEKKTSPRTKGRASEGGDDAPRGAVKRPPPPIANPSSTEGRSPFPPVKRDLLPQRPPPPKAKGEPGETEGDHEKAKGEPEKAARHAE